MWACFALGRPTPLSRTCTEAKRAPASTATSTAPPRGSGVEVMRVDAIAIGDSVRGRRVTVAVTDTVTVTDTDTRAERRAGADDGSDPHGDV
jgi:hypothetical protein